MGDQKQELVVWLASNASQSRGERWRYLCAYAERVAPELLAPLEALLHAAVEGPEADSFDDLPTDPRELAAIMAPWRAELAAEDEQARAAEVLRCLLEQGDLPALLAAGSGTVVDVNEFVPPLTLDGDDTAAPRSAGYHEPPPAVRRGRWVPWASAGLGAAVAAAAVLVLSPASTSVRDAKPQTVAPAPLLVTDFEFSTCEPTEVAVPTRAAIGTQAPTRRRASKARFVTDTDAVLLRREDQDTDLLFMVSEVPASQAPAAPQAPRVLTIDRWEGYGIEVGIGGEESMRMTFEVD